MVAMSRLSYASGVTGIVAKWLGVGDVMVFGSDEK